MGIHLIKLHARDALARDLNTLTAGEFAAIPEPELQLFLVVRILYDRQELLERVLDNLSITNRGELLDAAEDFILRHDMDLRYARKHNPRGQKPEQILRPPWGGELPETEPIPLEKKIAALGKGAPIMRNILEAERWRARDFSLNRVHASKSAYGLRLDWAQSAILLRGEGKKFCDQARVRRDEMRPLPIVRPSGNGAGSPSR